MYIYIYTCIWLAVTLLLLSDVLWATNWFLITYQLGHPTGSGQFDWCNYRSETSNRVLFDLGMMWNSGIILSDLKDLSGQVKLRGAFRIIQLGIDQKPWHSDRCATRAIDLVNCGKSIERILAAGCWLFIPFLSIHWSFMLSNLCPAKWN